MPMINSESLCHLSVICWKPSFKCLLNIELGFTMSVFTIFRMVAGETSN